MDNARLAHGLDSKEWRDAAVSQAVYLDFLASVWMEEVK